ncbi:MAG: peptidylprolyl isomerase [Planctomycetia bacterium]|nr:peptidylprolyl isomerase [Planctomycetia bacterium]
MNSFSRFWKFTCLTLVMYGGFSWKIHAQEIESPIAQTSVFCEKCERFPNYEDIFNPEAPIVLPAGMTQEALVKQFCDTCRKIDVCLTEIDTLKKQYQELENRETLYHLEVSEVSQASEVLRNSGTTESSRITRNTEISGNAGVSASREVSVSVENAEMKEISEKKEKIKAEIYALELQTHAMYHQTIEWIGMVWRFAPQEPEVTRYMLFLLASTMDSDQFEAAYVISRELMLQRAYESNPFLYEMAGISAFMMNKFDVAKLCFNEAQQKNILSATAGAYLELIPYYAQAWKTEQTLRRQEALKGNLPRVLLETTRGEVEIELFTDSAPETVKTFLELVNQKFYDGDEFSTVLSGLFAQTGKTVVDLRIPDEFNRANTRKHFRGSVVLTHGEKPDSGTSRFFIMLAPAMQLDGKFTVFGRVVSGMENISALERMSRGNSDGKTPDKILRARVLSQPIPE